MPTIQDIRAKYPQYNDMNDEALASSLHQKFYSDMPEDAFRNKIGLAAKPPQNIGANMPVDPNGWLGNDSTLGRIDAAIGGPGNTIRRPIADIGGYIDAMNPFGTTQAAQRKTDTRSVGEAAGDLGYGIAGLAGITGDTMRTLGMPDAGAAFDKSQQSFQQHNGPQLQTLSDIGNSLGGLAPEIHVPAAIRVPTVAGAAGRLSTNLGEAATVMKSPEAAGVSSMAAAAKADRLAPGMHYRNMTPTAETAGPHAIPQPMVDSILDAAASHAPVEVAKRLGIPEATAQHYVDRFNNDVLPNYHDMTVDEILRRGHDGTIWQAPNLRREAYDAANTSGEGSAKLEQGLRFRQANQADDMEAFTHGNFNSQDYAAREAALHDTVLKAAQSHDARLSDNIENAVHQHFGTRDFDKQVATLLDDNSIEANARYKALEKNNPGLIIPKGAIGPGVEHPLFKQAEKSAELEATMIHGEPWDTQQGYSVRQINRIQKNLRRAAQSPDPAQAHDAGVLRSHVTNVADRIIQDFGGTRGWFKTAKDAEEAAVAGRRLGLLKGDSSHADWQTFMKRQTDGTPDGAAVNSWFRKSVGQSMIDLIDKGQNSDKLLDALSTRQGRARVNALLTPGSAKIFLSKIDAAIASREMSRTLQKAKPMDAIEKASKFVQTHTPANWLKFMKEADGLDKSKLGHELVGYIDRKTGGNADRFLGVMTTRAMRKKVMAALGPTKGKAFLNRVDIENLKKSTLQGTYGGSDTAPKLKHAGRVKAVADTAMGLATLNPHRIWNGVADMASHKWQERRANNINAARSERNALRIRALLKRYNDKKDGYKPATGRLVPVSQSSANNGLLALRGGGFLGGRPSAKESDRKHK